MIPFEIEENYIVYFVMYVTPSITCIVTKQPFDFCHKNVICNAAEKRLCNAVLYRIPFCCMKLKHAPSQSTHKAIVECRKRKNIVC